MIKMKLKQKVLVHILDIDACITRLRIKLKDNTHLNDDTFTQLGAAGVIRPDNNSIQIVLGSKSESVASEIRDELSEK
jgi:PTS system N-acetylglucosamine-specific IIC component